MAFRDNKGESNDVLHIGDIETHLQTESLDDHNNPDGRNPFTEVLPNSSNPYDNNPFNQSQAVRTVSSFEEERSNANSMSFTPRSAR